MAEPIQTKRCSKCKQIKPLSEFHKDRKAKNGFFCWCKICNCERVRKYAQTEKGKTKNKQYAQSEKRKANMKHYCQSKKGKTNYKRYYIRYPERLKAKSAANHAIRSGKLPRANTRLCRYCSKPAQQWHHWHGYEPEHWLDVIPVCRKCHILCHKKSA